MLTVYGTQIRSRLILGTARYPSPAVLTDAISSSGVEMVTVSLRRQSPETGGGNRFWSLIRDLGVRVLPNTAGCRTAKEAITTAKMARDLFETDWIKLEVIGYEGNLCPDPFGLVAAAEALTLDGFRVFPYMSDDVVVAERLVDCGCECLMPWAAPIGSGQGMINPQAFRTLRDRFPQVVLIVDAGLGRPSHATQAMELGADAVLLNTAVARASDPARMARAFAKAVEVGREAYLAGIIPPRDTAVPSTPVLGTPFWRLDHA